jgi:hypothetical protein
MLQKIVDLLNNQTYWFTKHQTTKNCKIHKTINKIFLKKIYQL